MAEQLHVFFFPLNAAGHFIPMADTAALFAHRGVKVTLLALHPIPPLLAHCIQKARDSGSHVDLLPLHLPEQHERGPCSFLTNPVPSLQFMLSLEQLRDPLGQALRAHRPSCLISDMYLPWTADVARRLGLPRLVFHTMGFFPLCVLDSLDRHITKSGRRLGDCDVVVVPCLPHRVEMKRLQLHDSVETANAFGEFLDRVTESELASHGAVVNSFYELEPQYAEHYRGVMGRKAWHIGPVSLHDNQRDGNGAGDSVLAWLNSKPPNSVIYVCFGSLARLTAVQCRELGLGLLAAGHAFVWVVNEDEKDGVGEQGKGLVVRGWAPQRRILRHAAVGAFVTHCGWNAVVEAASSGVPMVTWPLFADQFYNERLVVNLLRVGTSVGAEVWGMEEERKPVVSAEAVARAVARIMEEGGEGESMRRRAADLGQKAREAVEEGGSSWHEVGRLIREISTLELEAEDSHGRGEKQEGFDVLRSDVIKIED